MFAPLKSSRSSRLLSGFVATLIATTAAATTTPPAVGPTDGALSATVPGHDPGATLSALPATPQGDYGQVALSFEPNEGQAGTAVQYLARGPGYEILLTPTEAVLGLRATGSIGATAGNPSRTRSAKASFVHAQLAGSDPAARVEAEGRLPGYSNYLIGSDPARWHTHVAQYQRVRYRGIYPNVDLVYYGNQQQLEYDFVVAPGGNPGAIRLHYAGIDAAVIDPHGDLHLRIAGSDLVQRKPTIYQPGKGARTPVDGGFSIVGDHPGAVDVAFSVADYDRTRPLVIDPVLTYSTFLGGSTVADAAGGIAVDANGRAYLTGSTISLDFPTTAGSVQSTSSGQSDAFVTKLSADGKSLVYSTYLGGSLDDFGNSIAIDASGAAYVLGSTASADFPVTAGAFQSALNGGNQSDVFVAKLSVDGSRLAYATYLGGTGNESAAGIAVDSTGAAYITGQTYSQDFPTVAGAIATLLIGNWDGFVSKLSASGGSLVYSTYLGGANDSPAGIAVDGKGAAYVTGSATTTFPTTPGAFQTANAGPRDAFVSKLSANGSRFLYSTFLGGSANDAGAGIAVDSTGAAYVAGTAASVDFPVTSGAYQATDKARVSAAFVSKLSAAGSALVYSTYLSGTQQDSASSIAIDAYGRAYVTGTAQSADFPVTAGAPQGQNAGNGDAFVSVLNPSGAFLTYSTFLGGASSDSGTDIAVDKSGNAYVTGQTSSADFPTTSGAYQGGFNGSSQEVFVFRLAPFTANPGTLNLGNVPAGAISAAQSFTLTNNSTGTISLSSIRTGTPQFILSATTCTSKLAVGANCSISVRFAPTTVGAATDAVTVSTSDGAAVVPLTGFGTGAAGSLSPIVLDLGNQLVGTTSGSVPVTLTNTGTTPLLIGTVTTTGPFTASTACANLAPGANCPINVQFVPTVTGTAIGSLTVATNAYQSLAPVSLSGTGIAPVASLSATALNFGNQSLGSSTTQSIVVTNTGTGALMISSIGTAAPFIQTNNCTGFIQQGNQCTINVTFAPTATGSVTGALTIASNALGSPAVVSLSGSGVGPQLKLSAVQLAFGNQAANTTSAAKTVTVSNIGSAALTISSITAGAPFVQTNNCGTLATGASCSINVSFAPTASGYIKGSLTIASNAYTSPDTVKLTGTGVAVPLVSLSPTSLSFGTYNLGTTSGAKAVQLTNTGISPLSITSIGASPPFSQTNNCGSSLAAGAKCSINVSFRPTTIGNVTGAVTLVTNASSSPDTVALSGAGAGPQATVSPTAITFPPQAATTTSRPQTVTVTNSGTASLAIGAVTATSSFVVLSNTCGTLAPGGTCAIGVAFSPPATGSFTGTLSLTTNAYDSPSKVALSGSGI